MEVDTIIQLFKPQKTVKLINTKSLKKNKIKRVQRKKLIYTECQNNINTIGEELISSENVGGTF